MWQSVVVAGLVAGSGVYAVWTLCPKAWRSPVARQLLKRWHPQWLKRHLAAAAKQQGGCACDGCDRSALPQAKAGKAAYQPLVFQPRPKAPGAARHTI